MKTIHWVATSFALMFGATIGGLATAASGDLIYEHHKRVEVTGAQGGNIADAFIAAGAWDGNRADMIRCIAQRDSSSSTGMSAWCVGLKTAAPGALPVTERGVNVVGIVE